MKRLLLGLLLLISTPVIADSPVDNSKIVIVLNTYRIISCEGKADGDMCKIHTIDRTLLIDLPIHKVVTMLKEADSLNKKWVEFPLITPIGGK